jgi:hypothetical protein
MRYRLEMEFRGKEMVRRDYPSRELALADLTLIEQAYPPEYFKRECDPSEEPLRYQHVFSREEADGLAVTVLRVFPTPGPPEWERLRDYAGEHEDDDAQLWVGGVLRTLDDHCLCRICFVHHCREHLQPKASLPRCPECNRLPSGTCELIPGVALLADVDEDSGELSYTGETKVVWNGQTTNRDRYNQIEFWCETCDLSWFAPYKGTIS